MRPGGDGVRVRPAGGGGGVDYGTCLEAALPAPDPTLEGAIRDTTDVRGRWFCTGTEWLPLNEPGVVGLDFLSNDAIGFFSSYPARAFESPNVALFGPGHTLAWCWFQIALAPAANDYLFSHGTNAPERGWNIVTNDGSGTGASGLLMASASPAAFTPCTGTITVLGFNCIAATWHAADDRVYCSQNGTTRGDAAVFGVPGNYVQPVLDPHRIGGTTWNLFSMGGQSMPIACAEWDVELDEAERNLATSRFARGIIPGIVGKVKSFDFRASRDAWGSDHKPSASGSLAGVPRTPCRVKYYPAAANQVPGLVTLP